jgi:phage-related protein
MERICQLVIAKSPDGKTDLRYQNYDQEQSIKYNGRDYEFLPFLYQGATRNKAGDNMESTLVFAVNQLVTSSLAEHVEDRYIYRVITASVKVDDKNIVTVKKKIQEDVWLATSLGYDSTEVDLLLSSAIDAVGANTPNRFLTSDLVGALPVTGSINTG